MSQQFTIATVGQTLVLATADQTVYSDSACTQTITLPYQFSSDLTAYVPWEGVLNITVEQVDGTVLLSQAVQLIKSTSPVLTPLPTEDQVAEDVSDVLTKTAANGTYAQLTDHTNTVAASGTAQTIPDVTTDTLNVITLTGNCTFTFPTAAAGKSFTLVLTQDATGSRTATWPVTVKWSAGAAPTLTTAASKTDVFTFICADGANWLGFTSGQNY